MTSPLDKPSDPAFSDVVHPIGIRVDDATDCPILTFDAPGQGLVTVRLSREAAAVLGRTLLAGQAPRHIVSVDWGTEKEEVGPTDPGTLLCLPARTSMQALAQGSLNLNDQVTVRLTPHGLRVLLASRQYVRPGTEAGKPYREQLWALMRAFGAHMRNGADPLFEGNNIELAGRENGEEVRAFTGPTGERLEAVSDVVDGVSRLREVRHAATSPAHGREA